MLIWWRKNAVKLKPQDKKTLQIIMLRTGRLRTTWFYSWGQLLGQTHGGSGSWTTSKTYLTSSASEYKRTKNGFILFPDMKVAGQSRWACWSRAYLFMIGQGCHDCFSNHDSHCHTIFSSVGSGLCRSGTPLPPNGRQHFLRLFACSRRKRNIDQFLRGIDWVTTGLQRFSFFFR